MICLCLGRRGMDDGYTYGMQPSSARASVASSEGYGPNRASRSTHEDAFGGGDPLGEPPPHSAIHSLFCCPLVLNSIVLASVHYFSLTICWFNHSLLVHFSQSVSQSINQSVKFSRPCSASCVCLQHECHPHQQMLSACANLSIQEAAGYA